MIREDIIRMAREVGGTAVDHAIVLTYGEAQRFAALVAAAEREACAEVCEKQIKSYMSKRYTTDPLGGYREIFASEQCAAAIRARGTE